VGDVDPGEIDGCARRGDGTGERPGRIVDVELAAARALLARLDPELTRVGVVSFGAGRPVVYARHRYEGPDSGFAGTQLEIEPTADFAAVEATLDVLAEREPEGATNVSGAVARSVRTLLALPSAAERRMIVLLSDGIPTAPRLTDRENLVETVRAAGRAARSGVRILSFAIGEAVDQPVAAIELAERTGGAFYPIRDAASLPSIFSIVHLDQIADLAVTNTTTGASAVHRRLTADGSWDAVVPLAEGANELEIRARTEFGAEVVRTVEVQYASAAPALPVPEGLYARRDAARSEALDALAAEHAAEREALARKRAELMAEIQRERDVARGVADGQRRELDLEAEPPAVGAGPN
jgi:hypothetical protein